jgi:hypothetical protein
MAILDFLGGLIKPVVNLVDDLVTSDEERGQIQAKLIELQNQLTAKVIDYETKLMESKSNIIVAEAKSESWITRSWRPIVMLTFTGMLISYWLGYSPPNITPELLDDLFAIIKIGLGGYIGGRSLEKIVPPIVKAVKGK